MERKSNDVSIVLLPAHCASQASCQSLRAFSGLGSRGRRAALYMTNTLQMVAFQKIRNCQAGQLGTKHFRGLSCLAGIYQNFDTSVITCLAICLIYPGFPLMSAQLNTLSDTTETQLQLSIVPEKPGCFLYLWITGLLIIKNTHRSPY